MYLGNFSLTAWGADRNRDKLVESHQDGIYVLGTDGTIIARFQAPMPGSQYSWTTYGTPMLALISARYYATLQRYDKWNRSVLRVYDNQNGQFTKKCSLGTAHLYEHSRTRTV